MAWLYLHARRACYGLLGWLAGLTLGALGNTVQAVLALLGEEFRRWVGILAWGAMIFLAGKAVINFAPVGTEKPLAMTVLVLAAIWAFAAMRAAHYTMHNSLRLVRQRMWFRQMAGDVSTIRQRVGDGLARVARGTPADRLFKSNREADAAAEQRRLEAEARAAEAEQEAEEQERRLDELAAAEPNPYR